METITEIRRLALEHAPTIQLPWETIDKDPSGFAFHLEVATKMIPDIESLYEKLLQGVHVSIPNENSTLNYNDREFYCHLVADELYNAYIIQDIYDRFKLIQSITEMES
jgi:hypothetical protein